MSLTNTDQHLASAPLSRAFRILETITQAQGPVSVAELARQTGIPKPTTHRLVSHLIAEGLLRSDTVSGDFVPGGRFWEMFCNLQAGSWQGGPVRVLMEQLVDDIRETCNLGVFDRGSALYIERVECDWPIRIQLKAGSRVPLHASAIGKLLLAYLPAAGRRRILDIIPRPVLTANTIIDADKLEIEFARIRRLGYALNNSESTEGLIGLAVPVRTAKGRIIAGLSVHAPTSRLELESAVALLPRFEAAAKEIGHQLEYRAAT